MKVSQQPNVGGERPPREELCPIGGGPHPLALNTPGKSVEPPRSMTPIRPIVGPSARTGHRSGQGLPVGLPVRLRSPVRPGWSGVRLARRRPGPGGG